LVPWFVARYRNPLTKIGAALGQKGDRLRALQLREEKPLLASFPAPSGEQLERCARHSRTARPPPISNALPDQIDKLQLDDCPDPFVGPLARRGLGITVEVEGLAPAGNPLGNFAFDDVPMRRGSSNGELMMGSGTS
jgi:hypothetical protein